MVYPIFLYNALATMLSARTFSTHRTHLLLHRDPPHLEGLRKAIKVACTKTRQIFHRHQPHQGHYPIPRCRTNFMRAIEHLFILNQKQAGLFYPLAEAGRTGYSTPSFPSNSTPKRETPFWDPAEFRGLGSVCP